MNARLSLAAWAVLLPLLVAGRGSAAFGGAQPVGQEPARRTAATATPIEHLVVVMQQNHTYDNYFGTYPGGEGLPSDVCMPASPSIAADRACIAPFYLDTYPVTELSNALSTFAAQYNDGLMNGFAVSLYRRHLDGKVAMGHYDDRGIPYYWNLADEFVLFDHYFSSAHTGSIMNRMFWISGAPGSDNGRIPPGGYGDLPTIFDRLQDRGISWKFYIRNYDPDLNYRTLPQLDYLPPQTQWAPLLSFDRFLDDPALSSRIVDLDEYFADVRTGDLPAVAYVLLLGASEHPPGDLALGQRVTRSMIQALMQSDAWDNSAFMITYDDWGGWYDHVPPPQVDQYGYGFRVPTLLVSAYARKGYIDSTQLDHTSFLKFIESNWGIPPLAQRDAAANNFMSAFDLSSPPRPPIFVSATRQDPQALAQPRIPIIYVTYGSGVLFALLFLVRASVQSAKPALHSPLPGRTHGKSSR